MNIEEEIQSVSKLMKIEVDDHTEYVDKVRAMLKYFEILDSAGVESEDITVQEMNIAELREDIHVPFEDSLIEKLNRYKDNYVRAPKMS